MAEAEAAAKDGDLPGMDRAGSADDFAELTDRLEAQLQGCLEDLDNLKKIADSKEGEKLVEALGDIKE